MKHVGYKKFTIIITIITAVSFFTKCINNSTEKKAVVVNNKGEQFAGSETCQKCHREVFDHFINTAHQLTSFPATEENIKGSFVKGENIFSYSYYSKVAAEKRDSGIYQVEYDKNFTEKQAHLIDIAVGSGTRGQSYLYWKDNLLFQLPVSYFTLANQWSNSPGYPVYQPLFNRSISSRCLECHSTYFKTLTINNLQSEDKFDRKQIIYGVQCESCHGPAKNHVDFHEQNPGQAKAKFVINPASLTRRQQIDLCAYCHGGIRKSDKAAFDFSPEIRLSYSDTAAYTKINTKNIEVHDNQYALLRASKCFKMSMNMTCNTCHNTHRQERGNLALFSIKCMTCHTKESGHLCKMTSAIGADIGKNCISCHMPERPSQMLTLQLEGQSNNVPATLRSHVIAIYPEETQKFFSANNFILNKK